MRLTAAALVLSWCSCAAAAAPAAPGAAIPVRIHIAFDRTIASAIQQSAERQAHELWRDNGVDVQWIDGAAQSDFCLDVTVERRETDPDATSVVLGRAQLHPGGDAASGPIRIAYDAIEVLLDGLYGRRYDEEHLRNARIGTALGRVLAHELGHVLLGPPVYHDARGLMRPQFLTRELAGPDRAPFRLVDQSLVRLRTRLASLTTDRFAACTAPTVVSEPSAHR